MAAQSGGSYNENMPNTDDSELHSGHAASVSPSVSSAASDEVTFRYRSKVKVNRPVYTQLDFNEKYNFTTEDRSKNVSQQLRQLVHKRCAPSRPCAKKLLLGFFPFISIMRQYSLRRDLFNDIIAGLTVGIMHIPQGMAYGMLANLDPVYGLYSSFFPVIIYYFFGTSRHISLGTFAVVSLMIGTAVSEADCGASHLPPSSSAQLNSTASYVSSITEATVSFTASTSRPDDSAESSVDSAEMQCRLGVAVALTFIAGIYQIAMGLFKFGFVTIYLSEPLTRALTFGASIHVFSSQIKHVFGIKVGQFSGPLKLVYLYGDFFENVMLYTNGAALITAVFCMAAIYAVQRWINPKFKQKFKMPVPAELIAIIIVTLVSYLANFATRFEVKIVGDIPTGLPAPSFPPASRFGEVAGSAFSVAIVSFAVSIAMGKLFAKKHSYHLDSNQELLSYGISNTVSSLFSSFVSTASLSRSIVQETSGGKTQVTGLVSCAFLLVVLLAIAPLFEPLPNCVLAAIVIVNLKGVFLQALDLRVLYRRGHYFDLVIWLVTAGGVILTEVGIGLLIGVLFSLLTIVFRTQRPHTSVLGRLPQTDIYEDVKAYPVAREIPGIKIFSFSSSLYYANATHFVQRLYKQTDCNPAHIKQERAQQERRRADVERRRKKAESVSQKRKKRFNLTADQDDHMFTDHDSVSDVDSAVVEAADAVPDEHSEALNPKIRCVVVDCSSMMFIDCVGTTTVQQVMKDYSDIGVTILFACCREAVFEKLWKAGVFSDSVSGLIYLDVHDAVLAAVELDATLHQQLTGDVNGPVGSVSSVLNANLNSNSVTDGCTASNAETDRRDKSQQVIANSVRPLGSRLNRNLNGNAVTESSDFTASNTASCDSVKLTANNSVRTPGSWQSGNVNRNAVTESSDYTAPNTEPGSHVDPLEPSVDVKGLLGSVLSTNLDYYIITPFDECSEPNDDADSHVESPQLTPSSIEPPGSLMNADLNRDAVTESSDYTAPNTEPSDRVNSLEVVQHPTEVAVDVKGLLGSLLNANVNKNAVTELDDNTVPNTKPHNRDKSQEE